MSNRAEVLAAYQSYLDAFMASDEQAIRERVRWPRALIGADRAESVAEFPYSPTDLKRHKDWTTSAGLEIDVVAVSDVKAHVLLRNCERVRADGTLIEEVSALYAFTKLQTAGRSSQCPASNSPPPPNRTQSADTQRSTTAIPPTDAERSPYRWRIRHQPHHPMRCCQVS
jgi:hypothetical protein